jgi:hypothetical protein
VSTHRFNRREFTKTMAVVGTALAVRPSSEQATVPPEKGAGQREWLQGKNYLRDVLGTDLSKDTLYRIGPVASAVAEDGDVLFTAPLITLSPRLKDGAEAGPASAGWTFPFSRISGFRRGAACNSALSSST